jgi:hypothetical protein
VPGVRRKLGPKYDGLYQVLDHMGMVAYHLQLPDGTRVHDVFHMGMLKPFRGTPPTSVLVLPPLHTQATSLAAGACAACQCASWHLARLGPVGKHAGT